MSGSTRSSSEPLIAEPTGSARALLRETFTFSAAFVMTGALLVSIGALSLAGLVSGALVTPPR